MSKKNKTQFTENLLRNKGTYMQYYYRLCELSMSMFEWKNLPDSIDPRFLELTLFEEGQAVFFKDEVMGYLALQNAMGGALDVYRIPKLRRAYAVNGYSKLLSEKDSVIIYNNYLHTNSILDVKMFAERLYNIDRAIDVNVNAQITPILIRCNENERLSLENIYKEYEGNSPVIFGTKDINLKDITSITTQAPYVADKLYTLKTQIWNEALTYLGISNINVQKKERLISDEVQRNQGGTIASRYSRLESRRQACDKINKMFGLNIECDYREDARLLDDIIVDEEGDNNE